MSGGGQPKKQFQSQALRAPEEKKVHFESEEGLVSEHDIKLTNEEITRGIEQAREAFNAPPLDLVNFEQILKAKHDELKAAGITPKLTVPTNKPKFKVPIRKTQKKK